MRIVAALFLLAGANAGAIAVRAADPDQTLAGPGAGAVVLLLAVTIALSAAGVVAWRLRPHAVAGPLLLCAAAAWCAAQLVSPAAPSAVLFTAGLAFGAAAPGAIAIALLPDRRAGAVLAVASAGLLGVLSAATFEPAASGCAECPRNLLLMRGDADLFEALQRAGLWLGLAAIVWLLVAAARMAAARRPARQGAPGPRDRRRRGVPGRRRRPVRARDPAWVPRGRRHGSRALGAAGCGPARRGGCGLVGAGAAA